MDIIQQRINCWNDTIFKSQNLLPPKPSEKICYIPHFIKTKVCQKSKIIFMDMDSIDCCLRYNRNALILNLAHDLFPGGGVAIGEGAQEESLFRRTNLFLTLKQNLYPIKPHEVIYSPSVSVIKTSEQTGWQPIELIPKVSFITCPGIKYPQTIVVDGENRLNPKDVWNLKMKIETIIQTAIIKQHDTIILGALGCGAWRNPIKHVAEIFKEVLDDYDGTINNFLFAILSTSRSNSSTVDIFKTVFNQK